MIRAKTQVSFQMESPARVGLIHIYPRIDCFSKMLIPLRN